MQSLLTKGSIPILLGTGGVGKTTIAAALALAGASAGLNTAVITVICRSGCATRSGWRGWAVSRRGSARGNWRRPGSTRIFSYRR